MKLKREVVGYVVREGKVRGKGRYMGVIGGDFTWVSYPHRDFWPKDEHLRAALAKGGGK